jgi:hypothetical protein
MSIAFRICALDPEGLERIRARGVDDFGNPLVVTANTEAGGTPLRCCLREAAVGEHVTLMAYQPARVGGPYAEVGPIFVHAERCDGYERPDAYPEGFRHRRLILRAYNVDGHQVDNQIVEGREAEAGITALLSRPEVAYLHARNVLAGCYMFTVTRP